MDASENKPQRIDYIDCVKGIGILLVILGHILPDTSPLKISIYSFHMPLFFIAYGMVMKIGGGVKELIVKRSHEILFPYVFWGLAFTGFTVSKRLLCFFWSTNESIGMSGSNGMLWFLPVMFLASIISNFVLGIAGKRRMVTVALSIGLMIASTFIGYFHGYIVIKDHSVGFPLSIDVVLLASSFMLVGYMLRFLFDSLTLRSEIKGKSFRFTLLPVAIILIISAAIGLFNSFSGDCPVMAKFNIGFVPMYWFVAIIPCFGLILAAWVFKDFQFQRIFVWLGQNSMIIFIMHRTVIYPIKAFLNLHDSSILYVIAVLAIALYGAAWAWLINTFSPGLVGKSKKL